MDLPNEQEVTALHTLRDTLDTVIEETGAPTIERIVGEDRQSFSPVESYTMWSEVFAWEIMKTIEEDRKLGVSEKGTRHRVASQLRIQVWRLTQAYNQTKREEQEQEQGKEQQSSDETQSTELHDNL